jgi:hypothetical protein
MCEHPYNTITARPEDALYEFLHGPSAAGRPTQGEMGLEQTGSLARFANSLVVTLKLALENMPDATGLVNLSSHHVILRAGKSPLIVLEQTLEYGAEELDRWRAPELLSGETEGPTEKSLVYTIGVMMWELMTTEVPFGSIEDANVKAQVGSKEEELPVTGSGALWRVVKECVRAEEYERPTLAELQTKVEWLLPKAEEGPDTPPPPAAEDFAPDDGDEGAAEEEKDEAEEQAQEAKVEEAPQAEPEQGEAPAENVEDAANEEGEGQGEEHADDCAPEEEGEE